MSRNHQLNEIANYIREGSEGYTILAGDLNVTPYSYYFRDLLRGSGLIDSGLGYGWQPTWSIRMPWFAIPIDHILVSPDIQVTNRAIGPSLGSDHHPVVVSFDIK